MLPCAPMTRRERLTRAIEEAERELAAAKRLSEVNRAAKKLQQAKRELGWLEDEQKSKPRPSCGRGPTGDAS
jgi:hypothetical protein